jgi:hypothetical protein
MKLEEFDIELIHKAGSDMIVPDALSRYVAGASIEIRKEDNTKAIMDAHVRLGHRGWKVVLEDLRKSSPWKGMRQEFRDA